MEEVGDPGYNLPPRIQPLPLYIRENAFDTQALLEGNKYIEDSPFRKPPLPRKLSETVKYMNMHDIKDKEIDRIARIMNSSKRGNKKRDQSRNHYEFYSSDSDKP